MIIIRAVVTLNGQKRVREVILQRKTVIAVRSPALKERQSNIRVKQPEKFAAIVQGLKDGKPVRLVAVQNEVSPSTVAAIKFQVQNDLPAFKRQLSGKYGVELDKLTDRLIEIAGEADSVKDVSIALGIVQDKLSLLSGENTTTVRVEHIQLPSANDIIAHLRAANPLQTDRTIIDVPVVVEARAASEMQRADESPGGGGRSDLPEQKPDGLS